jgi:signal transduction histidine kinase
MDLSGDIAMYNFLLWFSVAFLTLLMLIISYLVIATRKAREQEAQSSAFSRETVIAQEQERSRIAGELHDTVAQELLHLSFQTEVIGKTQDPAQRNRLCAEVSQRQKELMRRVRNICENLIPPDFQHGSLPDALANLCYAFEKRTGIECRAIMQDGRTATLAVETKIQCFRIAQECLANIEKHSGAAKAQVLMRENGGALLLIVSDNGKGFDVPGTEESRKLRAGGHLGLWNMHERALSVNGTLTVDSEAGEGTTVTLTLPLTHTEGSP